MISKILKRCTTHAKNYDVSFLAVFIDYIHSKIFYGFSGEDYFLNSSGFALKNFQKKHFFSHKAWIDFRKRLNDDRYIHILKNKVETLKYFSKYIDHKWCYPVEQSEESFDQFVLETPKIIYKPTEDEGGKGIGLMDNSDNRLVWEKFKEDKILLEECITQHPEMYFNNKSVNTIRVYSVLDRNRKARIVKAVLRVGVGESVVDNYHSGGVIYPINVERGFIEAYGVRREEKADIFIHPGSDILMLGFVIPHWDMLKERVIDMAESIPQIRFIGWDMVVTPTGVDLIEANDNADHALFGRIGIKRLFLDELQSFI